MDFQKVIVTVKIICKNKESFITNVDVVIIAGGFDTGSIHNVLKQNHPGCSFEILDIEWVVSKIQ